MLDKDVFIENMEKLLVLYPAWNAKLDDENVARTWYEQFKHMDDERFVYMVNKYIENEKFPPTVKGLLENDTIPRKSRDQLKHEQMLREQGYYD